jgi:hypothetical protein
MTTAAMKLLIPSRYGGVPYRNAIGQVAASNDERLHITRFVSFEKHHSVPRRLQRMRQDQSMLYRRPG